MASRTSGSTGVSSSPTRVGGRRSASSSTGWSRRSSPSRSSAASTSTISSLRRSDDVTDSSPPQYEVAVVGAGQAGLAIGYFLARQGRSFVILDAADSVGAAWRQRWDSLTLFTPRRYDGLPGLAFPGEPDGYPIRDEVVAYLATYAQTFALPIELRSAVRSLRKDGETFVLGLDGRTVEADQVVVATGPFQTPRLPDFAGNLALDVFQTHSADYRVPSDVP